MHTSIAIMAAGFGTRMKSKKPKVLHEISGFPMLHHIIKEAQLISNDIHVILHHQADLIQKKNECSFSKYNLRFTRPQQLSRDWWCYYGCNSKV